MKFRHVFVPTLLLLLGAAARIAPLTDNRFHPDEALYASYGRLISTYDWNLASRLVDKPPLFFYILAGSFQRVGPNEVAARLPGLAASILSLALLWRLALQLWRRWDVALIALGMFAFSPMAILFAPTAFTDPLLVMWFLASLVAVTENHWGWGGTFAGLALATKQTALSVLPLVILLGILMVRRRGDRILAILARMARFAVPVAVTVGLLVAWELLRADVPDFWQAGLANNAPDGVVQPGEVLPRLRGWVAWMRYVGGWLPVNLVLVVALVTGLVRGVVALHERESATGLVLAGYMLMYFSVYWLVAFNIYDRYLLPLVPLAGLMVGQAIDIVPPKWRALGATGVGLLMLWPAFQAAHSGYPVGGDHGAYDGIDDVAAYLDSLPDDTIIYDHWLGWPLDYYLFDSPAYTTYFPTSDFLVAELNAQSPTQASVVLLPAWAETGWVLDAVSEAGYEGRPVFKTENCFGQTTFTIFRLSRPAIDSSE